MKTKSLLLCLMITTVLFSSCGTLFTSTRQDVTFKGVHGTDIYDNKDRKIGEIGKNGFATVPIKKKIGSKKVTARLDGYATRETEVKSRFNPICVINLLCPLAWIIDLCTGKVNKYSGEVVDVTLVESDNTGISGNGTIDSPDDEWIE